MTHLRAKTVIRNVVEKSDGSPMPFIGLESIQSGTGRLDITELPVKKADDSLCHRPGDVLFSKLRPYLAKSILASAPGTGTGELLVLRPHSQLDSRFLFYVTLSRPWLEWAEMTSYGSKMPRTSWDAIGDYSMWIPSLEEQRRIADFLDAETARIDRLNQLRLRQLEILRESAVAIVDEGFAQLPEVPRVRLGYLSKIQSGITVDASRAATSHDVTRPYLRVANVQSGYVDLDSVIEITVPAHVAASSTLRPGDVLMTEGGDLDKLGRGTVWDGQIEGCMHQNHVFAIRANLRYLEPQYLALLTQSTQARMHFESTGVKTTNLASTSSSKIRDLRVPLPSPARQKESVKAIMAAQSGTSSLADAIVRQRALIAERRQALITAAVTGQFDVTTGRGADLS